MEKWNAEEFIRLVSENPELDIMLMVDTECVFDDSHGWWAAKMGKPSIDNYYVDDERIYLKSLDFEDLVHDFIDNNYDDEPYKSMTDEELDQEAKRVVEAYDWTKAIMLPIDPQ